MIGANDDIFFTLKAIEVNFYKEVYGSGFQRLTIFETPCVRTTEVLVNRSI